MREVSLGGLITSLACVIKAKVGSAYVHCIGVETLLIGRRWTVWMNLSRVFDYVFDKFDKSDVQLR